jgi:hypothetical protein
MCIMDSNDWTYPKANLKSIINKDKSQKYITVRKNLVQVTSSKCKWKTPIWMVRFLRQKFDFFKTFTLHLFEWWKIHNFLQLNYVTNLLTVWPQIITCITELCYKFAYCLAGISYVYYQNDIIFYPKITYIANIYFSSQNLDIIKILFLNERWIHLPRNIYFKILLLLNA